MTKIIKQLNQDLFSKRSQIFDWLEDQLKDFNLIYSSQDIRNSGYKISAVDVNYFPAGFNNLSTESINLYCHTIKNYLANHYQSANKIIIIAENFSRNLHYLDNIDTLKQIFTNIGMQVETATLLADGETSNFTDLKELLPKIDKKSTIFILNNDLSNQVPEYLNDASLNIMPPVFAGWYQRSKAHYFNKYNSVISDFSKTFNINPFLLSSEIDSMAQLDFKAKIGIEILAEKVELLLNKINKSYMEHNISNKPYVVIKSDSGTFGMAIMKATSGEDIISINKKQRNKMNVGKGGNITEKVLIQEGIPSVEKFNNHIAESMVYSACNKPISLISRYHQEKNELSILNTTGMEFQEICLLSQNQPDFFLHYVVSSLSQIAAKKEISELSNK
jgi:glutamate--cysteine ligase